MKIARRYLTAHIQRDLKEKLVLVGGPRQVGKTTLAISLLSPPTKENEGYLNWDIPLHRQMIRRDQIPASPSRIVLDEVHKYRHWRRLVKGFYDQFYPSRQCLVTGSARLDYYRRGGDSLVGRYHYYRLHPLSLPEIGDSKAVDQLLKYGGFPEPFLKADERFYRRWGAERITRVIQEEVSALENVSDLSMLELLVDVIPERVGSPLSINSLAEDLEKSHATIKRWLDILGRIYVSFLVLPLHTSKLRAIKKTPKLYLWDWAQVEDEGTRFENMVACHLLKYCHYRQDTAGYRTELRYFRDRDGRELDFIVLEKKKPLFAVECKLSDKRETSHLMRIRELLKIPRVYCTHRRQLDRGSVKSGIRTIPFWKLCNEESLV